MTCLDLNFLTTPTPDLNKGQKDHSQTGDSHDASQPTLLLVQAFRGGRPAPRNLPRPLRVLSSDFINTLLESLGSDPEHPTPQDFVPSHQSSAAGFLDSLTHHLTGFPNFTVQARAVPPWPSRCWRSLFKDGLGNIQEDKVINAALSISIPQLWCPRSSNLAPTPCFPPKSTCLPKTTHSRLQGTPRSHSAGSECFKPVSWTTHSRDAVGPGIKFNSYICGPM